jgi:hypothetical protein
MWKFPYSPVQVSLRNCTAAPGHPQQTTQASYRAHRQHAFHYRRMLLIHPLSRAILGIEISASVQNNLCVRVRSDHLHCESGSRHVVRSRGLYSPRFPSSMCLLPCNVLY